MMCSRPSCALFLIAISIAIIERSSEASGKGTSNPPQKHERIKVPLGRRLVDVLSDNDMRRDKSSHHPTIAQRRRFEIEANNDTTNGTTKLMVEEIHQMAITSQNMFHFKDRNKFDPTRIKDITILASNPKDQNNNNGGGGLTIRSVNESNG